MGLYVNVDLRMVFDLFWRKVPVSWILFRALNLLHFEGIYIQIWLYLHFDWFWSKVLNLCCASKRSTIAPQLLLLGLPGIGFGCAARFNDFTYASLGQTDGQGHPSRPSGLKYLEAMTSKHPVWQTKNKPTIVNITIVQLFSTTTVFNLQVLSFLNKFDLCTFIITRAFRIAREIKGPIMTVIIYGICT